MTIKLSDFALTRSMDIHGISCLEWHDFYTMVRWEVEYLDSGALRIIELATGRAALVGSTLVSLAYVKGPERKPEAVPVVPDAVDEPTVFLTEPPFDVTKAVLEHPPVLAKPSKPRRKFEK